MMVFASTLEPFDNAIPSYHLLVPEEVAQFMLKSSGNEVACHLDGDLEFNSRIRQSQTGQYYLPISFEKLAQLGLNSGQLLFVELRSASSLLGPNMSTALKEALQSNPQAEKIFYEMSPGNRHSVVYFVDHFHDEQVRPAKAASALQYILESNGNVDFKMLLSTAQAEGGRC